MSKSEQKYLSGRKQPNVLLLMSGSIACVKASALISAWTRRGSEVRVACTRSVCEFIGHSSLQGLGADRVFDDVFAAGQAMEHISLGKWADVIVAAPATSNLINKLSAGIADDAVTTVWQAAYGQGKPMVIVPAMNTRMWRYPATQESISRLDQWGINVLPVGEGELACGERGEGRMLEPDEILKLVDGLLNIEHRPTGKHILITAGGTRERIDSVRYIGNTSSGRTAARLADALTDAGHELTWLGAQDAMRPSRVKKTVNYYDFADMEAALRNLLATNEYDAVIHAAAVSDFSVASIETGDGQCLQQGQSKLSSGSDLVLRLKRNPKLLSQLKTWTSNPSMLVVGFKLTDTDDAQLRAASVKRQFECADVDAVVHNDLADINADTHRYHVHLPNRDPAHCENVEVLATTINNLMEKES